MNFVEWPVKNRFIPLPGDMRVTKQTDEELVIEGRLPDRGKTWDRQLMVRFAAEDGALQRMCRTAYRTKAKKKRWTGKDYVEYDGTRGSGGLRQAYNYIGWLLQDWAT